MDRKLNELLNRRFDGRGFGRQPGCLAGGVFKDPEKYICGAGVLGEMQASDRYVMMERAARDEMDMAEDLHKLYEHCMDNLLRWLVATAEVKATVHGATKRFLDAAAEEARSPKTTSAPRYLEGRCESVHNARWSHVVEVPGGEGTGMEVGKGNHRSHGITRQLATLSKRMTVWGNPVHRVPG
ncbi:putative retrotransposon hot spot protein (RHS) [Trypanosoma cruzi]|uniref:Putative retrotransposon hot spot protein (RHS) n=1 Tax=Trypanosoma cruzi TaxID=5693 RepID=A0A2V2WC73_TRYCR|nr:putative retrotransposon hot spot protein (RHS) [Trypanosoma cruzi]